MKIHVFGSDMEGDDIAPRIAEDLKNVMDDEFVYSNDPTDLMEEDNIIILDAVKDLTEVRIFTNVDDFADMRISSLHDFDLGFFLKLAEKMDMKKKITVIGLPMQGDYEDIKKQAMGALQDLKGTGAQ